MKKFIAITVFLCLFIFAGCQKAEITETKAKELAKLYIEAVSSEEFIKTIINYSDPTLEKTDYDDSYPVFYFEERNSSPQRNDLIGKKVWKITYNTTFDNFLGPHTIYLDRYTGEIYGSDLRD
jgi:hypothetical protein